MENLDFAIILAQIINVGILFYLFKRFVADKLHNEVHKKRNLTEKLEHAEKKYKIILDKAQMERESIIERARVHANKLFSDMESLALMKGSEILKKAETKAELIIEGGKRQVEKERLSMLSQVKGKVIDLSLKLNKKLFQKETVDKDFMQKELDEIEK